MFLNHHVLNRLFLPADDWRQQLYKTITQKLYKTVFQNHQVLPIEPTHFFTPITQILTNINNIQTTTSHSNYYTAHPSAQPLTRVSNPTYIISSVSISEPIKPFDVLDLKYTPKEYLQRIEARVTFSLGLQPTNLYEYTFWHA